MEALSLTAAEAAAAAGGDVVQGNPRSVLGRVSIDSRTVSPGDFFVAIRGERFDGHAFVAAAVERGAAGVLVEQDSGLADRVSGGVVVIAAAGDTTAALQGIAREVRRRSGAQVVAITGSAGKTTTKEVTAELLAARYRVYRNKGNLNNHIGLPLSLIELRERPEIAVVELGMNHPGEIRTLTSVAEPEVRVWTNVGDAHLGFFASADAIAHAKAEIVEDARPTDLLVANADDARVMAHARRFAGRVVTFGGGAGADVRADSIEPRGLDGTEATVATPAGTLRLTLPLLGTGNLSNVLAATAVALHFDVPLDEIASRVARLRPAARRGELSRLPGGITLVDDSYNSSPAALRLALDTLATASGSARKVAVLGEMLELGVHAERLHAACGEAAAAAGLDVLITVGGDSARTMAEAAVLAGMPRAAVAHVPGRDEAAALALERIRPGDLVLVKGSRGIGTDRVVDRLKAEYA